MLTPPYHRTALVIVDLQRYYLEPDSGYARYFESIESGSLEYIRTRCETLVIPNVQKLLLWARDRGVPVAYLRLCGTAEDRSDLHPSFRRLDEEVQDAGFGHGYPTRGEPMAEVVPAIRPRPEHAVFDKTTFSGFTTSEFGNWLQACGIRSLICTGLATSQCVETTARDAADRGMEVILIEDAIADYDHATHQASLYASRGVCGGAIYATKGFIEHEPIGRRLDD